MSLRGTAALDWYLHKACEPVSSSESSRVVRGSRSGKGRWVAHLVAILVPVGVCGGWGRDREGGFICDLAGEPKPKQHGEDWVLLAGCFGTLQEETDTKEPMLMFCLFVCRQCEAPGKWCIISSHQTSWVNFLNYCSQSLSLPYFFF